MIQTACRLPSIASLASTLIRSRQHVLTAILMRREPGCPIDLMVALTDKSGAEAFGPLILKATAGIHRREPVGIDVGVNQHADSCLDYMLRHQVDMASALVCVGVVPTTLLVTLLMGKWVSPPIVKDFLQIGPILRFDAW